MCYFICFKFNSSVSVVLRYPKVAFKGVFNL